MKFVSVSIFYTSAAGTVEAVAATFRPAEVEFERILRNNRFMTASLKAAVQAPSIEDEAGFFVILPDILAIDLNDT